MALRIAVPTIYGIDADYWVITGWTMDFAHQAARVDIGGWSSKAKFTAGFGPLSAITFRMDGAGWPFGDGSGNLLRAAYDKIKTLPPFTQATEEA